MPELAASNVPSVVPAIALAGIVGAFRQRGLEAFEPHEILRLGPAIPHLARARTWVST
jgi:hypothetical protein